MVSSLFRIGTIASWWRNRDGDAVPAQVDLPQGVGRNGQRPMLSGSFAIRRRHTGKVVFLVSLLSLVGCQRPAVTTVAACPPITAAVHASWQLPILPIKILIDSDGKVSVQEDVSLSTPAGRFSLGGEATVRAPEQSFLLILRNEKAGADSVDTVYCIRAGDDEYVVVTEGRTELRVRPEGVVVNVTDGQAQLVEFRKVPRGSTPAPGVVSTEVTAQQAVPAGTATLCPGDDQMSQAHGFLARGIRPVATGTGLAWEGCKWTLQAVGVGSYDLPMLSNWEYTVTLADANQTVAVFYGDNVARKVLGATIRYRPAYNSPSNNWINDPCELLKRELAFGQAPERGTLTYKTVPGNVRCSPTTEQQRTLAPMASDTCTQVRQTTGKRQSLPFPSGVCSVTGYRILLSNGKSLSDCTMDRPSVSGVVVDGVINGWPEEGRPPCP